jgi:hypothetical protein
MDHDYDNKFNSGSTRANDRGTTSWQTEDAFDLKTKTNTKDKPKCALCGKEIKEQQRITKETFDGTQFIFDTLTCATLFKKLNTVYGGDLIHLVQQ